MSILLFDWLMSLANEQHPNAITDQPSSCAQCSFCKQALVDLKILYVFSYRKWTISVQQQSFFTQSTCAVSGKQTFHTQLASETTF